MTKSQKIVDELREKIEDYESNMGTWLEESNQFADLYRIKPPKKRSNTYSNPRLPEMHRAVETLTTTAVRMMTAQDPYFELRLMDFDVPQESLYYTQKTLETQLKVSHFKAQLTKAFRSLITFGTVFVEEPFEWQLLNPFGRKMPVTHFLPRSIIQMGFDRSSIDICNADWKYTNDLISKGRLRQMAKSDALQNVWNMKEVDKAIADESEEASQFIRTRLSSANYPISSNKVNSTLEIVMYYGKLDCLNDDAEYICGLVNRKYLCKFAANPDQNGAHNFRIAKWIDFEAEPLGYGLGRLLARSHRSMDANRQKMQDLLSFGAYNIWLKSNMADINSQDLQLRPNKVIGTSDMGGLRQLVTDTSAALNALKLEEIQKQDFRAASGATDTLQASTTDATASEVVIVQNEAMRKISVYVENIADPFMGGHIEKMHNNNRMNLSEPFIISTDHGAKKLYPKDINIDVDVVVKVVTDKDFRPKRTEQIFRAIELASSIRQESMDKYRIDITPLYKEAVRGLDINPNSIIRDNEEAAQMAVVSKQLQNLENMGMAGSVPPADIAAAEPASSDVTQVPGGTVNLSA